MTASPHIFSESPLPDAAIVWQDTRTQRIVDEFASTVGVDRYRPIVGLPLATYFCGPKVKWILDNVDGARALLGKALSSSGKLDEAVTHLTKARDLFAQVEGNDGIDELSVRHSLLVLTLRRGLYAQTVPIKNNTSNTAVTMPENMTQPPLGACLPKPCR